MTNQIDVLAIAREAGLACIHKDGGATCAIGVGEYINDELLTFASAILERAAVECEIFEDIARELKPSPPGPTNFSRRMIFDAMEEQAKACKEKIRALKPQQESPCN